MELLAPPDIPSRGTVSVELPLRIPREGIARNELLQQYQSAIHTPSPESKALQNELQSWSGLLARTDWFSLEYTPTSAAVLKSRSVRVSDAETPRHILRSCVEIIEPLSRYSAGWCDSLATLAPSGLRRPVSTAVREAQRFGARAVRSDMSQTDPQVQMSRHTVRQFLVTPATRHRHDERVAVDAYLTKVALLVEKGVTGKTTLTEAETSTLTELGTRLIDHGAQPADRPGEEEVAGFRRTAVAFLNRVVETHFADGGHRHEHMAEAFERVVTTYVNRQCLGKPLEGTEHYLKLRLAAVQIDEWRRERRRRSGEHSLVAGQDSGSARADDRAEDTAAPNSAVGAHEVVSTAIQMIDADSTLYVDGQLCWEGVMATTMLAGGLGVDPDATQSELSNALVERWTADRPRDSRSTSARAAAMDALLLARTAVNRALRSLDIDFGRGATS